MLVPVNNTETACMILRKYLLVVKKNLKFIDITAVS